MLINSLAALALGFALDMLLGDPEVVVYPQYFIKKLVAKLDKSFRNSYKNTPEAQRMAGLTLVEWRYTWSSIFDWHRIFANIYWKVCTVR